MELERRVHNDEYADTMYLLVIDVSKCPFINIHAAFRQFRRVQTTQIWTHGKSEIHASIAGFGHMDTFK